MTRPRVPIDKRQRTAQACDSCKKRKQKCNGLLPCATCQKKTLECHYSAHSRDHDNPDLGSPAKRRHIEVDSLAGVSVKREGIAQRRQTRSPMKTCPGVSHPRQKSQRGHKAASQNATTPQKPDAHSHQTFPRRPSTLDSEFDNRSRKSITGGSVDEEAEIYPSARILQDPRGRLLYVGDSATLSYLQLIRMIVWHTAGPSRFTEDPNRHRILENTASLPADIRLPQILPDRFTADILIGSYFTNTAGMIHVFDKKAFISSTDACYSDPLATDTSFLCLLYLVMAIGLVMATPAAGSPEEAVIRRLRSEPLDRAEIFCKTARSMADPGCGFEDADFWSIQALILMSVYMLAVSKRSSAYSFYGMAVRSAFALGLHRGEILGIFDEERQALRRHVWRSLFVLDRFLAASLGRPIAISEVDCSGSTLNLPSYKDMSSQDRKGADENAQRWTARDAKAHDTPDHPSHEPFGAFNPGQDNSTAAASSCPSHPVDYHRQYLQPMDSVVQSSHILGIILQGVYSRRRISTKIAQAIAEKTENSIGKSLENLRGDVFSDSTTSEHEISLLHAHLVNQHAVVLLTRPFLLFLIRNGEEHKAAPGGIKTPPHPTSRLHRFAEACVRASYLSIQLVQRAHEANVLPQQNPFVLYFLFAASLIILSSEFAGLFSHKQYPRTICNAISILRYCSAADPQAVRLLFIVEAFSDVVKERSHHDLDVSQFAQTISPAPSSAFDPPANFQVPHDLTQMTHPFNNLSPSLPRASRQSSQSSVRPVGTPMTDFPPCHGSTHTSAAAPESDNLGQFVAGVSSTGHSALPQCIEGRRLSGSMATAAAPAPLSRPDSFGDTEIDFDYLWDWPMGSHMPAVGAVGSSAGMPSTGAPNPLPPPGPRPVSEACLDGYRGFVTEPHLGGASGMLPPSSLYSTSTFK